MMNEAWYEVVDAAAPLTQGDLIADCPLVSWDAAALRSAGSTAGEAELKNFVTAFRDDVVVLTQACDLEHHKVENVVLCPHVPLLTYRRMWEEWMRARNQSPSEKTWKRTCEDIASGYVWNQTFLNRFDHQGIATEIRVVDFHDIFTVPRSFLEPLLQSRKSRRLRLLPPYREHLSQSFARFFMRVGLPQPVEPD
jgi:hypothetical protein